MDKCYIFLITKLVKKRMIVKSLKTSQLWGLLSSTSIYSMYRFNSKIHVI